VNRRGKSDNNEKRIKVEPDESSLKVGYIYFVNSASAFSIG